MCDLVHQNVYNNCADDVYVFKVPLMWLTARHLNGKIGNMVVWATVVISQPIGILMYYHDYYIINS
jgi:hypothetical protein